MYHYISLYTYKADHCPLPVIVLTLSVKLEGTRKAIYIQQCMESSRFARREGLHSQSVCCLVLFAHGVITRPSAQAAGVDCVTKDDGPNKILTVQNATYSLLLQDSNLQAVRSMEEKEMDTKKRDVLRIPTDTLT